MRAAAHDVLLIINRGFYDEDPETVKRKDFGTMKKVAVVYWSGTGNTQAMAEAVAEGAKKAGADVTLMTSADFGPANVGSFDAFAFGCPAMGAEVLEETEFQPMWDEVKSAIGMKPVVLFGSYGWGDGEWMRSWAADAESSGISLAADFVICNDAPDDDAKAKCEALGAAIA